MIEYLCLVINEQNNKKKLFEKLNFFLILGKKNYFPVNSITFIKVNKLILISMFIVD